jgi:ribonuclease Z
VQITILGTSSAIPTFKRGLSSIVLDRGRDSYLFDCGEGTQFQLLRAGGRTGRLTTIFITHLHGDHFYGLPGLLSSLNLNRREQPLTIYGPVGIKRFVDFVLSFPKRQTYGYEIGVHELPPGFEGVVIEEGEFQVLSLPLDHRVPTHGYRFEEHPRPGVFDAELADDLGVPFGPERGRLQRGEAVTLADGRVIEPRLIVGPPRPGKVFTYCTDTGFAVNAKRLAQDCDLLVHESTYGDDMVDMAVERKHSTIRQAAAIAKGANARQFVATHFSTRYDRALLEGLEREGREVYPDLIMARDLMTVEV